MNEITLAVCCYNAEKYIEETLACIVNQTFSCFDLLIINDCSTDNSVVLIDSFFKKYPRDYEVINFNVNKGLAAGRHYVENYVQTKYILFVDADDCPYPNLVEKLYFKICSDQDLIAVGCYHEFIDNNSKKIGGGIFLGSKTKDEFFKKAHHKKLIFMQPTAIIKRDDVLRVGGRNISGFPDGMPRYQDLCEDLDLWARMSDLYTESKAIIVVPEVLNRYRKHELALSANSLGMILRMRHVKSNLILRRAGIKEKSFTDFLNKLTSKEMQSLKAKARSADNLRNAVFCLKKGKVFKGLNHLLRSVISEPSYIWQKLKSNSGLFKL